jgi:hypothetical protein
MSKQQTSELHAWRAIERQQIMERAIRELRKAQGRLHSVRCHDMPRFTVRLCEVLVFAELDKLWAAQGGKEQLKPVETVL